MVLSGAGGSWIDNILHKENPLRVRPVAELILGYSGARTLERPDPTLFLLQWAGDAADPPVFAPHLAHDPILGAAPRDVLMFQGITDTYILPPIANALSLAAGLDLAGEGLEARDPESARFTALEPLLPLSGGAVVPYPASANVGEGDAARTAVRRRSASRRPHRRWPRGDVPDGWAEGPIRVLLPRVRARRPPGGHRPRRELPDGIDP